MKKLHYLDQRFKNLWKKGHKYSNPVLQMTPAYFCFESIEYLGFRKWHSISSVVKQSKIIMASIQVEDGISFLDKQLKRKRKFNMDQSLTHTIRYFSTIYKSRLAAMQCFIEVKKEGKTIFVRLNTHSENLTQQKDEGEKRPSIFKRIATLLVGLFTP